MNELKKISFTAVALLCLAGVASAGFSNPEMFNMVSSAPMSGGVLFSDVAYLPEGREEKLDVYLPEKAGANRPCILYIHGGGWSRGDKASRKFSKTIAEKFIAEGIAVASINYTLETPRWPGNLYDCKRALRFVKAHAGELGIDPDYIIACGGSAGGHLAELMALTSGNPAYDEPGAPESPDSTLCVGIGLFGIVDLRMVMPQHKPRTWGDVVFSETEYAVAGELPVKDHPPVWKAASPLFQITKDSIPMLLVHGDADEVVEWEQSEMLYKKGKSLGVDIEFLKVPGAPHGIGACTFPGVMDRMISFVKSHGKTDS